MLWFLKVMVGAAIVIGCIGFFRVYAGSGEVTQSQSVKLDMSVEEARDNINQQKELDAIPSHIWKELLSPQQYKVLWKKGTEKPFTSKLLRNKQKGVYVSSGCEIPVFRSDHKYKSGTGWPSFWDVFDKDNVILKDDSSWGMKRTEILSKCGEHLGHVFEDGPKPTKLRYCINGDALKFIPEEAFLK